MAKTNSKSVIKANLNTEKKEVKKTVKVTLKRNVVSAKYGHFHMGNTYEVSEECANKLRGLEAI